MKPVRPLDLTVRQLEYVVAVADAGTFGAAADACAVSQPSLSTQVARVEELLGVVLFERSRPVRPTPGGLRLLTQARVVLREARTLEDLGRELADPEGGELRVGMIPTFAPYLLPRLHPALRAELPGLRLHWHEAKTTDLERLLLEGDLDLALLADRPAPEALAHRVVGHESFVGLFPGPGPATETSLAAMSSWDLLLLDDGHCLRDQTVAVCRAHALSPSSFTATSLTTLVQMVATGLGATLLPQCAVLAETARADVHARPLVEEAGREFVLVWRRTFPREPLVSRVADAVTVALASA
jgi:LysR family hydrogen peroxide-inducible transcriptional activator